jgi:biotin synthase
VVEAALALRRLDADSIPVNFLLEIEGTSLAGDDRARARRDDPAVAALDPRYALKVLCAFRFVNPTKEIRVSAGREAHLRTLQPMALYVANAIFLGDYLTEPGQAPDLDRRMIEDLGFEWEGPAS